MLTIKSPAKVNLFLQIVGRRNDGYHELNSFFQTVNLFDTITFERSNEDLFTCSDPKIPTDSSNLILKAIKIFRKKTKDRSGYKIHLEKVIPVQSGLGGGSSNAATTLWALNHLTGKNLDPQTLQDWGCEIGSDVPFFFSLGSASCGGRGEIVFNMPMPPQQTGWIIKPVHIGLSTAEVFSKIKIIIPKEQDGFFNDLEEPAFRVEPKLFEFKMMLEKLGFETVVMTGSGSAFVCIGDVKQIPKDLFSHPLEFVNRQEGSWYVPNNFKNRLIGNAKAF